MDTDFIRVIRGLKLGVTAVHRFAQRANDARAVIAFVHDNAVADSTAILPPEQAGVDQAGGDLVCEDLGL